MDLLEGAFEKTGSPDLKNGMVRKFDPVPPGSHFAIQGRDGSAGALKDSGNAAILNGLVGVTAGNHRDLQLFAKGMDQCFRAGSV